MAEELHSIERRSSPRQKQILPVMLTIKNNQQMIPRKISGVTLNTSRGGALLKVAEGAKLNIGASLLLEILTESEHQGSDEMLGITLNGSVVRIENDNVAVAFNRPV